VTINSHSRCVPGRKLFALGKADVASSNFEELWTKNVANNVVTQRLQVGQWNAMGSVHLVFTRHHRQANERTGTTDTITIYVLPEIDNVFERCSYVAIGGVKRTNCITTTTP